MTTEKKVSKIIDDYRNCRIDFSQCNEIIMDIIEEARKKSYIQGSNDNFKIMMDKDYCDTCLGCNGNMKPILYGYCDHCAKDVINEQTKAAR